MKKRTKFIVAAIIFLFVVGNLFLIFKEHSKIERAALIKNYYPAEKKNIKETLHTEGIVAPLEDYHYYYDQKMGSFKRFLVKKGETVEAGTPLYEYISADLDADLARLEAERAKVENEIEALERHIDDLTSYKDSLSFDEEEKTVGLSILNSVEQDIYNKELQADMLRQTADKLDKELQTAQSKEGRLTVFSEVGGIVKELNTGLQNPLLTISSETPIIKGSLNEEERYKVSTGIPAVMSTMHLKGIRNGILTQADQIPEGSLSENDSLYPFTIELEEEVPDLLQGTRVDVTLVTKEVNGAVLISKTSVFKKKFVWVIASGGLLEKREIKTGLESGHQVQVQSGVEKGEFIVNNPSSIKKGEGPAIMSPMNLSYLKLSELDEVRKKHILRYILKGIAMR